jgi:sugar/nucleoside kinase (ribokinase family)
MARPQLEIVHVGSACRDIDPADPRGWRLGGGVTYAALTTARLGLRTAAILGADADAAASAELETLRDAGVDVLVVPLEEGPVFHNVETPKGRVQTCIQRGVPLSIPTVPTGWLTAAGWSIVPVADEIPDGWADVIPTGAYVAVAWQGFLRVLEPGERIVRRAPRPSPILRRADLVGVSHYDVPRETPVSALCVLLHPGADLLITRGASGGLLVAVGPDGPGETVRYLPTAASGELDPTGAGDTFLAALQASALRPAIAGRRRARRRVDLRFAAAAGSLVVEGHGLAGVPDRAAVNVRRARERIRRAVLPAVPDQVGIVERPD